MKRVWKRERGREREREREGLARRKDVVGKWETESKTKVW